MTRRAQSVLVCIGLSLSGCRSVEGDYFWVDTLPPARADDGTCIIAAGDLLGVRVWGQEGMSVRAKVRDDGMVTIPFVNDFPAAGMEPEVMARRLQLRLRDFIVNPVVTITLEETRAVRVSVVGEVVKAGVYQFEERGAGVLQALAAAGGLTPFADGDRIFVLRTNHWAEEPGRPARIRFTFKQLARGQGRAATFALRSGDVVVVE
jgi:polysaccharide export outer membrane protein